MIYIVFESVKDQIMANANVRGEEGGVVEGLNAKVSVVTTTNYVVTFALTVGRRVGGAWDEAYPEVHL